MSVIVTGGGSGGHFYPAIAFVRHLQNNGFEVVYIGSKQGIESRLAQEIPCSYHLINSKPLGLSQSFSNLLATKEAISLLKKYRPSFVFGFGGYVMAPVILASIISKTSFFLHEQNVIPGRANQLFAPFAKAVALGFEESRERIKSKNVFITGTPVREEFYQTDELKSRKIFGIREGNKVILIIGGSKGSTFINNLSKKMVPILLKDEQIQVIHISGYQEFDELMSISKTKELDDKWIILPYLNNIWDAIKLADLVLCRGGASTLSELAVFKCKALVIPNPLVVSNHQYFNGMAYVKKYGGIVLEEKKLDPGKLVINIKELLGNPKLDYLEKPENNASANIMKMIKKTIYK